MNASSSIASGCQFGQHLFSQTPVYDNALRKKKRRGNPNQVIGKAGIIRPDKRKKAKYL
jgi:hypothetical protein